MLRSKATKQMVREYNMTTDERLKESYKRMRKAKATNALGIAKRERKRK